MTMTAAAIDQLLQGAQVRPDDAPGTAAALLWGRIADAYEVPANSPVAPLGVVDRVVLVLMDVVQLSEAEVASYLNSDISAVRASHDAARRRVGLPPASTPTCAEWEMVRAAHRFGDPATVTEIIEHVDTCTTCGQAAAEHSGVRAWWAKRAVAVSTPAMGGLFAVVPAFAATVAVAAAVTAGVIGVRPLLTSADDIAPLPIPIEVDGAPGLPSDRGPSGGVRGDGDPTTSTPVPAGDLDTSDTGGSTTDGVSDAVDGLTDGVDDLVGDVTDTVDDIVGDLTDTVEDLTDTVEDEVPSDVETDPALPDTDTDTDADAGTSTTDRTDVPIGGLLTP